MNLLIHISYQILTQYCSYYPYSILKLIYSHYIQAHEMIWQGMAKDVKHIYFDFVIFG